MIFLILFTVLVIVIPLYVYRAYFSSANPYTAFPGPLWHTFPLNPTAINVATHTATLWKIFYNQQQFFDGFMHVALPGSQFLLSNDLTFIKHVMKNRQIFQMPDPVHQATAGQLKGAMVATEGPIWEFKHNTLLRLHSTKMLEYQARYIMAKSKQLLAQFQDTVQIAQRNQGTGKPAKVNLTWNIKSMSMSVIVQYIFGIDAHTLGKPGEDGKKEGLKDILGEVDIRNVIDYLLGQNDKRLNSPPFLWKLQSTETDYMKKMQALFDTQRSEWQKRPNHDSKDREENLNIISCVLSKYEEESRYQVPDDLKIYTQSEMLHECMAFFFAGYETKVKQTTFVLTQLAMHPAIQQKVRDEAKRFFEEFNRSDTPPTLSDIYTKLPYTWASIKETERIWPLFNFIPRQAVEDTTWVDEKGKSWFIPKGTWVLPHNFAVQRSDKYFKNAMTFDPDRWMPNPNESNHPVPKRTNGDEDRWDGEVRKDNDNDMWMAFGLGMRDCFGFHLAKTEMIAIVATLMKDFKFTAVSNEMDVESVFGLRLKNEVADVYVEPVV